MVEFILTDRYADLFLLVNAAAIFLYLTALKKNKRRALKFGNYETLKKVAGGKFLKSSNLLLLIRLGALTALLVGISSPVMVEEVPSTESDYVLAIDSSGSMLSTDLQPDRFSAAKDISTDFVNQLTESSKFGIVSFSGTVNTELELSQDKEVAANTINELEVGEEGGTAIGDAVLASGSLLSSSNQSKSIILITDGRNNVGSSINSSISFSKRNNITVNTIGIGSVRNESEEFGYIEGVNASRASVPNLNGDDLFRLANTTGGEFRAVGDTSELRNAIVSLDRTERREDIADYLIFLGIGLLLLEWVLGATRFSIIP